MGGALGLRFRISLVCARLLRNRSPGATFLCYHSIAPAGPRYLTISAQLFEHQLGELRRRQFGGGDLESLRALARGESSAPRVFLTFDDGFHDTFLTAMPLLREYGFGAFVFVLPPLLTSGASLRWPEVADDAGRYPETMRSVDWTMLEEMKESGFEVGSHTLSHPHLSELSGDALREELWDSRTAIKERLGSCETLAYPFGDWSPEVAVAARDCGYEFAFSLPTKVGQRDASPYSIPRINVDYRDHGRRFAAKLTRLGKEVFLAPELAMVRRHIRAARNRL